MSLAAISTMAGILETGVKLFGYAAAVKKDIEALHIDKESYLRAYYFELSSNLELLKVINKDALSDTEVTSTAFSSIVQKLETAIAASILFGDHTDTGNSIYHLFAAKRKIQNPFKNLMRFTSSGEDDTVDAEINESVINAMHFTVQKIQVLQKLSTCDESAKDLLNGIRLKVRLDNIEQRLITIRKFVREQIKQCQGKD
ncbi:hypothetical protein AGMMS49944_10770 [Spirochaetia bacterium]|nr:hypothetical protein AGMMS49944_10770 [Spirochaetia bacterium]